MNISRPRITGSLSLDSNPTINSIARYAVAKDKVIEPLDANFQVDDKGNVVVEPDGQIQLSSQEPGWREVEDRKSIVIPWQEAYKRIVDATNGEIELQVKFYKQGNKETKQWYWLLLADFTLTSLFLLVLGMYYFFFAKKFALYTPIIVVTLLVFIIFGLSALIFLHNLKYSIKRVNIYFNKMQDIENFSAIATFISNLNIEDEYKNSLQKAIIVKSLGKPTQNNVDLPDSHLSGQKSAHRTMKSASQAT